MRRSKADLAHPGEVNPRLQSYVRWARRLGVVAMVVLAALIVRWYDFETLDDEQWTALEGKVRKGAFLIFREIDDDTLLGEGSLVQARVRVPPAIAKKLGRDEGDILTTIVGVPGTVISLRPRTDGRLELELDGEPTGATMLLSWQQGIPVHLQLKDGPIPPGHFLLINPAVDADAIDGRHVGLVPRSALQRKASYL